MVRITVGRDENGFPIRKVLGYYSSKANAVAALSDYNREPYDIASRKLTFSDIYNKWIETKRPWVNDGRRKKKYRSAFHFLRDKEDIPKFNTLTKNKYIILPIKALGVEKKPQTRVGSWLAKKIFVPSIMKD